MRLFLIGAIAVVGQAESVMVAFGDSTTAQRGELRVYSDVLRDELAEIGVAARVINAGVPGNSTALARSRFQSDVLAHEPDVVVVQFGINDAAVDVWKTPPATRSRVSLAVYAENLRYFVAQIRAMGGEPILMTPNPTGWTEKLKVMYGKPPYDPSDADGFNVILKQYAAKVREIAQDEDVPLIDIYALVDGKVDALTLDGMHPNPEGQQLVADALMPELLIALKRQ